MTELEAALSLVHESFPGTPQYAWPLLAERCGAEVWVKHENHTPTGAFKLRGGLIYAETAATRNGRTCAALFLRRVAIMANRWPGLAGATAFP